VVGRDLTVHAFFPDASQLLAQREPARLLRFDVPTGRETVVAQWSRGAILGADLAPGGRRAVVLTGLADGGTALHSVPLRTPPAPEREWITVSEDRAWQGSPCSSADGRFVYFLSAREGPICVWAMRVDPATGRPLGERFAVVHGHTPEASRRVGPRAAWGITVARDRLVFNASEARGNIWMADLRGR
jgi:Tol biopolymer transport system component